MLNIYSNIAIFAMVNLYQMQRKNLIFKKIIFTYFWAVFTSFVSVSNASPIDSNTAKTVAANFYTQNYKVSSLSLKLIYTEKSSGGEADYYIYNVYPDSGFVIVSADDAAHPIIGYSSEGYFPNYHSKLISPDFAFWMEHYKVQLDDIRLHHLKASIAIRDEWSAYKNNVPLKTNKSPMSSVLPLVKTVWAQAPYFNALCPVTVVDGIDSNDVAGCVATAMGQIMKYWKYPPHGIGSNSYSENPYGTLSADFDSTHYNWADMPLNVTVNNPQVATLMYDCGVAVDMDYSLDNSGAFLSTTDNPGSPISAESAFVQHFGYSASSIQAVYESNYSYTNWVSLLENELNNKRPVEYAGLGNQGGHSWVCDGYDASGEFHMNWGWAGYEDGYYTLNSLNPDNIPLSTGEEALIGIEPAPAVADINANPLIIRAGDTVMFADNSLGYDTITSWQWSFPGALTASSTAQNPMAIYGTPGTYNVTETVTTNLGNNTSTQFNYITVLENNTVNVYPTLSDGAFSVQLHDPSLANSNIEFSLYDMLGQKVFTTILVQYITQITVTVPHGMYFFRAFDSSGKAVSTGKLMIK